MTDCPNCGIGAAIRKTQLGYHCGLCDHEWPYDEPDYDFAQFREWCETFDVKVQWIHFEFVKWLYSDANTVGHL